MGRKSALTPDQWVEIERRHLIDGESVNSLAKAFKVDESTIRKKINPNKPEFGKTGKKSKPLQALAFEKIEAEKQLKKVTAEISELPISRQEIVNDLSRKLANVSEHLASGSEYSAATFHRLSALAHSQVQKIDDADPLASGDALRGIAALQSLANEAAKTPLNLLNANKEQMKLVNEPQQAPSSLNHFYGE
jgi:hypothetical protein